MPEEENRAIPDKGMCIIFLLFKWLNQGSVLKFLNFVGTRYQAVPNFWSFLGTRYPVRWPALPKI